MDWYFFKLINQFSLKHLWLDTLGIFFAEYFGYVLVVFLFLLAFYYFFQKKKFLKRVIFALISAVLARISIIPVRLFWPRQRPFLLSDGNPLLFSDSSAFPSGHAVFFFALSTIIFFYNKKIGLILYLGSFLICLARVFCGLHWPSDIIIGSLWGISAACFIQFCICIKWNGFKKK